MLEVNRKCLLEKSNSVAIVQKVLSARRGKVMLAVLPCNKGRPTSAHSPNHLQQNSKTTHELYSKVLCAIMRYGMLCYGIAMVCAMVCAMI